MLVISPSHVSTASGRSSAAALRRLVRLLLRVTRRNAAPGFMVIAAHPDDEVIGMGAHLLGCRDVTIVHTTNGSPDNGDDARVHGFADARAYAAARWCEFQAAAETLQIPQHRTICLGVPDQRATLNLVALTQEIELVLDVAQPIAVFTHAYEGGHPDHDATAVATHAAAARLRQRTGTSPLIVEMLGYHADENGINTSTFLAPQKPAETSCACTLALSPQQRELKQRLFRCFTTQQAVLQPFGTERERFRLAPQYDFRLPPHPGRLFYECFDWGMSGALFRECAADALNQLLGRPAWG